MRYRSASHPPSLCESPTLHSYGDGALRRTGATRLNNAGRIKCKQRDQLNWKSDERYQRPPIVLKHPVACTSNDLGRLEARRDGQSRSVPMWSADGCMTVWAGVDESGSQAAQNRERQRAALFPYRQRGRSLALSVLTIHRRLIRDRPICHAPSADGASGSHWRVTRAGRIMPHFGPGLQRLCRSAGWATRWGLPGK